MKVIKYYILYLTLQFLISSCALPSGISGKIDILGYDCYELRGVYNVPGVICYYEHNLPPEYPPPAHGDSGRFQGSAAELRWREYQNNQSLVDSALGSDIPDTLIFYHQDKFHYSEGTTTQSEVDMDTRIYVAKLTELPADRFAHALDHEIVGISNHIENGIITVMMVKEMILDKYSNQLVIKDTLSESGGVLILQDNQSDTLILNLDPDYIHLRYCTGEFFDLHWSNALAIMDQMEKL